MLRRGYAGRKDDCAHVFSDLGSALSQERPRSPRHRKINRKIRNLGLCFTFFPLDLLHVYEELVYAFSGPRASERSRRSISCLPGLTQRDNTSKVGHQATKFSGI